MNQQEADALRNSTKYITDSRFAQRACAVNMRRVEDRLVEETANNMMKSNGWVSKWTTRYEEGGLDDLHDRPHSGRPPFVERKLMKFMEDMKEEKLMPRDIWEAIRKTFGVTYHMVHIRRLMRKFGLSPKSSEPVHVNRASDASITSWQWRLKKRIPRLEKDGFTIGVFDEANYIHDMKAGRKYWSTVGQRIYTKYTGSHRKITAHGVIFFNGSRVVVTEEGNYNSESFIRFLKDVKKDAVR